MTPFWAAYLTFLVFFFGACIGSFLNVCIYRIPLDLSVVKPRSRCPKCETPIAWYDNVPMLSYVILRAKCRHCGVRISARYFFVELLTALLFLLVWQLHGMTVQTPAYWIIMAGLVVAMFVDFDHMIIPDRISLGGMAAGLAFSAMAPSLHGVETTLQSLAQSGIGLAAGSGSLWLVGVIGKLAFKKDAMGLGDVKLLGGLGAFLGWQAVIFIILISSVLGSVAGLFLIATGKKEFQSRIPYGPYLALAAVAWMLGGNLWWDRYIMWVSGQ
ncbi:MAG TPA: prepilin peptidase [Kiritimatiellia bacterium]|jgi:leader peptidase (prepilin peptidase)/N-methyltransferase